MNIVSEYQDDLSVMKKRFHAHLLESKLYTVPNLFLSIFSRYIKRCHKSNIIAYSLLVEKENTKEFLYKSEVH